jgi:hypothetical protein
MTLKLRRHKVRQSWSGQKQIQDFENKEFSLNIIYSIKRVEDNHKDTILISD